MTDIPLEETYKMLAEHQKTVEHLIKWGFNGDDMFVNDLERACIKTAIKLAIIRKYPIVNRFPILRFFAFVWLELRESISHETGKYYIKFRPVELKKLGREEVFMELNDQGLSLSGRF